MTQIQPTWRCPMCHQPSEPVDVHGHVQCRVCGQNVDPCCSGENACPVSDSLSPDVDIR